MSASNKPVRSPRREKLNARLTASVDLPTPPLALDTATVCATLGTRRFVGKPRWARGMVGAGEEGGCRRPLFKGEVGEERGRPFLFVSQSKNGKQTTEKAETAGDGRRLRHEIQNLLEDSHDSSTSRMC